MTVHSAESLKRRCAKQWQAILNHRFMREMGNDSLPLDKFVFYLEQDHIFLNSFSDFLLKAKQKSEDAARKQREEEQVGLTEDHYLKLAEWFDSLYHSTVDFEMQFQNELLQSLTSEKEIAAGKDGAMAVAATTTTSNYVSFLRKTTSSGSLEGMVAAMAPCPWSYLEIAEKLSSKDNGDIRKKVYRKWVQFYASDESQKQVKELKDILGIMYENASKSLQINMQNHFVEACKHEYEFWEMAYNQA